MRGKLRIEAGRTPGEAAISPYGFTGGPFRLPGRLSQQPPVGGCLSNRPASTDASTRQIGDKAGRR